MRFGFVAARMSRTTFPCRAAIARSSKAFRVAWAKMMERAGLRLDDVSFAEVHDCFTIAELMQYEAIGLTSPARGIALS